MPKSKYQFNKKSLQFEKVPITLKTRLLRLLSIIATGSVFAAVVMLLAYNFLDSPKEKMLKRENANLLMVIDDYNEQIAQIDAVVADMADRDDNIYRVILEAEPVATVYRKAGYGGSDRYSKLQGYKSSEILIATAKKLDKISSQLVVQSISFDTVYKMALNKEEMLACIPAIQPVSNTDLKRLSSYYGYRTDPIYKVRKFHSGIDFSAPTGTEIYATGDGVVKSIKSSRTGYGKQVVINHGYGYQTMYAHLHKFDVKKGQKVKRGQLIGLVGNTGKSTAPHLHYEIIKNGKTINPIYFFYNDLTPEEYEQVLEMSESSNQSFD